MMMLLSSGYCLCVAESECLCDDDGLVGRAGDCDVSDDVGTDVGMSSAHNGDFQHLFSNLITKLFHTG